MKTNNSIEVTELAQNKLKEILANEKTKLQGIRLKVIGGGCSGLSYKIDFDNITDKDSVINLPDLLVMIDPKSLIYLKDSILDYSEGLESKGFIFRNPHAKNTCGCGDSFNI